MAESRARVGPPRKHIGGWASEHRRISLSNDTFARWRRLKEDRGLSDDNAVAVYLLTCCKNNRQEEPINELESFYRSAFNNNCSDNLNICIGVIITIFSNIPDPET